MSIHDHMRRKHHVAFAVAGAIGIALARMTKYAVLSVGMAIRWGLIAFLVVAGLVAGWRAGWIKSKSVRTVEQAVAVAGAGAGVRP
jgi:hypothetical protein